MGGQDKRDSGDSVYETIRPLRILVAEDNRLNQLIIQAITEKYGHQALIVEDGAQAVAANAKEAFDLILMDVRMPELSGPDATRMIRSADINANIPIIALTADATEDHVEGYLLAGMNACVTKPIDHGDLLETINRVIGDVIHQRREGGPDSIRKVPEKPASAPVGEPDPDIEDFLNHLQNVADKHGAGQNN